MSYILDALQRADAERARGGVPTLHARPIAGPLTTNGLTMRQRTSLAIVLALAVVAAALAWWLWRPVQTPMPTYAASTAVVTPQAVAVPAAPVASPALAGTPYAVAPLPSPSTAPTRAVAAGSATPPPAAAAKPKIVASAADPAPPPAKATAVAVALVVAAASAPPAALAPLLAELPEALRRQIPAMAISGAVYSDNPAQRLLLVNGQVLNQGSQVAPDLTVVEIRANNSEFNFRGTRFRMAH